MTANTQDQPVEQKPSDKELNFRALEAKYERQLAIEKSERERIAREADEMRQKLMSKQEAEDEEDDDSDPYIDTKKFKKGLSAFEKRIEEKIEKKAEQKARSLIDEDRRNQWMRSNPDFYDVLKHAETLAQKDPELAETILEMPDTFERQKLVYRQIKAMGLHKPAEKTPSVQDKVDANKRSPYYQPSGVGTAPSTMGGDYSPAGQKQAYEHLQQLKSRLRI